MHHQFLELFKKRIFLHSNNVSPILLYEKTGALQEHSTADIIELSGHVEMTQSSESRVTRKKDNRFDKTSDKM